MQTLPLDITKWEDAARDALCLCVFEDERPLRGAAGLVDWRLAGKLSRLILAGRVQGAQGEALMLPGSRRMPVARMFWFGLGAARGYNEERAARDLATIATTLQKAQVRSCVVQLPGRSLGLIGARRAVELIRREPGFSGIDVSLVDDQAGLRDIADALRRG